MKILFLTQVLPYPLDAGPKTRAYWVLRYLVHVGHDVTLLSFTRETDSAEYIAHLQRYCRSLHTVKMPRSMMRDAWHLLRTLPTGKPFLIGRDWVPEMARTAIRLVQDSGPFDVIHADQLWMAPYALLARDIARARSMPIVLDQHNAVFQIPRRLAGSEHNPLKKILLRLETQKLLHYEKRICRLVDEVVWVTEEDRAALDFARPKASRSPNKSAVIPIALDTAVRKVINQNPNPRRITFLGGLHWPPNADGISWFKRDVWPLIAQRLPGALMTVIGRDPPLTLRSDGDSAVEIAGHVVDPAPYLADTAVFIIPLRAGGGMRVKILDAWSWGVPVVSTRTGAEGILSVDGGNILLADSPRTFADAVVRVMTDPLLARRLAKAGRETVEKYYDWRHVYRAWDDVYRRATSSRRRTCAA